MPTHACAPQVGARLLLDAVHSVTQRLVGAGGGWEGFATLEPPRLLRPGVRVQLWSKSTPLLEGGVAVTGGVGLGKGRVETGKVKPEGKGAGDGEGLHERGTEAGGGRRGRAAGFLPCVEVGMDESGGVQVISSVPGLQQAAGSGGQAPNAGARVHVYACAHVCECVHVCVRTRTAGA